MEEEAEVGGGVVGSCAETGWWGMVGLLVSRVGLVAQLRDLTLYPG